MKTLEFTNEKGNIKPLVREQIKKQGMELVEGLLNDKFEELELPKVERTARGTLAVHVANDTKGEPIYMEMTFTANQTELDFKPNKKSRVKKSDTKTETPSLF